MTIEKTLRYSGFFTPIIFWAATFIAGAMLPGYTHYRGTISALGAIGAPSQTFMLIATLLCALFALVFVVCLTLICRKRHFSIIPAISIISVPAMFFWAAIFPSGNPLHSMLGPVILLLYIGILVSLFVWTNSKIPGLWVWSIVALAFCLLIFVRFIPGTQEHYSGLIQRFAHMGWSIWMIGISATIPTNKT